MRQQGVVTGFNPHKGYGNILSQCGMNLFVHYSQIFNQPGFRELREGQLVEFEIARDKKRRYQAIDVVVVED